MAFVESISHNVWTEVRKQESFRKTISLFVLIKGKRVAVFHQVTTLSIKVIENQDNRHVQNNMGLKYAKNVQIAAIALNIWAIECNGII